MSAKFERFTGADDQYYFRYYGANGDQILRSEGYSSTSGRDNGIDSVKENSKRDGAYDKKTATGGTYYFNMNATNGQVIATSSHYKTTSARQKAIDDVKANAKDAPIE